MGLGSKSESKGATPTAMAAVMLVVGLVVGAVAMFFVGGGLGQTGGVVTRFETVTVGGGATVVRTVTQPVTQLVTVTVTPPPPTPPRLTGTIEIDGSSTVYPLTEAAAEAFMKQHPGVTITVGISGTGGGFKRFVVGETDINDASRPITRAEAETAAKNNIVWFEVPLALEGLAIVVHPSNNWVDCITISELREIWKPDSRITRWSQVRSGWPDQPIKLYGAGPDSGTFDYFTERVVGRAKSSRTDYVASEDDNVLIAGVAGERFALGYIPYAYVAEAAGRVKIVPVRDDAVAGATCVEPNDETVSSFRYPLSRPLFIYVNKKKYDEKPALREFVIFYLENGEQFVKKVKYTPLPSYYYKLAASLVKGGTLDGLFGLAQMTLRNAGPR
ncbi:MAG: PstS family phosphate ABC transporter substrate-binding protein [Thaumarchaeota archaeon]|nr:PstS family phosphate ABC transporter substrate-binding protein [Candidatus Calditenuaceae archaeon]MDW8186670.1 PstS family phosphate ABC transporter substrate-binding protein [Nitrososphaerota archaeon]